jgi:hypothetical protein
VVIGCLAAAGASVGLSIVRSHSSHPPTEAGHVTTATNLDASNGPIVLFRNAIPDKTFGQLAVASLAHPEQGRALAGLTCDRVFFAGGHGLCLTAAGTFSSHYVAKIFDAHFHVQRTISIPGIPSRARISDDGRLGAYTTFVNGDSYAPGNFSTRTAILDLATGKVVASLESFHVTRDGKRFFNRNFNFWGVTFAQDDDHFYATLGSGAQTYLVAGSLRTRTMRVLTTHVECPSLSPDGTRIAYKRSLNSHGSWRLYVLDLKTMRIHPLAETQSVDDQVEWLDDTHVLYWRGDDVWEVPADGSGTPKRFLVDASSPVVIRPAT